MKHMVATITSKFLELVIGTDHELPEMSKISISAPGYKELKMVHPMCKLACCKPENMGKDTEIPVSMPDYGDKFKDPSFIGGILTTHCIPITGLLSKFELDDSNFPSEGIHTEVDLEVMETSTCMHIRCNDKPKTLRFNRVSDYFHIVEAPK